MNLPEIKNYHSFSKKDLVNLGIVLKKVLSDNPIQAIFSENNPILNFKSRNTITVNSLTVLLDLGLIYQKNTQIFWTFLPILGEDLVFFRDLPKYNIYRQFVWLRETPTSGSWRFAHSLPIKAGTKI